MSAYLDRSQGITFVYSNIYEVYRKAKDAKLDAPFMADPSSSRVIKKQSQEIKSFQPKELATNGTERVFPVPMGVREAEEKAKALAQRPVANLQKNLSELKDAHEKLRFLLKEIETLTKKS